MSKMRWIFLISLMFRPAWAQTALLISQVYGGGGNTGAVYRNDFVELFQRHGAETNLAGWRVEYAGANGAEWQATPLAGVISTGRYYLIQQARGAGGSQDLPDPDASGTVAMSATAGKVRLVRPDGSVADLVGYGAADQALGEPVRTLSNTTAALRKGGSCVHTGNNSADFDVAAPMPRNSASPARDCSVAIVPVEAAISRIQGSAATSPLAGELVTTRGIVTLVRTNSFYIQTAPEDDDSDPATSEGLLIFGVTGPPLGSFVQVTGTVTEFRPAADPGSPSLTEITNPQVSTLGADRPLPEAVRLNTALLYPAAGMEALEHLEGMRVEVPVLRAVSSMAGGAFYGVLDGTPRPFREPGVFDGNSERLRVLTAAPIGDGALVRDLTGVLDYGFRTYTIVPEANLTVMQTPLPVALPAARTGELAVASMNLRRFTADATRIELAARIIRERLHSPAIIAVQEADTLDTLTQLARAAGPAYRAYLEEGNDPSGIDSGYLVNSEIVAVRGVAQDGKSATYTTPAGTQALLHDRPPLVLRARSGGWDFTLINVHLRSLIGIEDPAVQTKRNAQAEAVSALAARYGTEPLVVLGDFNAFPFAGDTGNVVGIIKGNTLTTLGDRLSAEHNFTFVQDGSAQALDHILANRAALPHVSRIAVARINTPVPDAVRLSDHDAPVVYLTPVSFHLASTGVVNAANYLTGPIAPGEIISIFGGSLQREVTFDGERAEVLFASPTQVNAIVPASVAGRSITLIEAGPRVEMPVAATAPGIFLTESAGGRLFLYGTGWDPVSTRVSAFVDGRPVEVIRSGANRGLSFLEVRSGPGEVRLGFSSSPN
jgi:hypothetical protein